MTKQELIAHNRNVILAKLREAGVKRVECSFDGRDSFDDVDCPTFAPGGFEKLDDSNQPRVETRHEANRDGEFVDIAVRIVTATMDLFNDIVGWKHPAWSSEDGGYGTITWLVDTDEIELNYTEREMTEKKFDPEKF